MSDSVSRNAATTMNVAHWFSERQSEIPERKDSKGIRARKRGAGRHFEETCGFGYFNSLRRKYLPYRKGLEGRKIHQ